MRSVRCDLSDHSETSRPALICHQAAMRPAGGGEDAIIAASRCAPAYCSDTNDIALCRFVRQSGIIVIKWRKTCSWLNIVRSLFPLNAPEFVAQKVTTGCHHEWSGGKQFLLSCNTFCWSLQAHENGVFPV